MLLTRTMFTTMAAAALLGVPATAQDSDSTVYQSASVPVWALVLDDEGEAGAHDVYVSVKWDDARSTLPFASSLTAGTLGILLPKTEDADMSDACHFTNRPMVHGSDGYHLTEREDTDCLALPTESLPLIWLDYDGIPDPMACTEAFRTDGEEDPARYFACYWAVPEGG